MPKMIHNVVILDPNPARRRRVKSWAESVPTVRVSALTSDSGAAWTALSALPIDVLLLGDCEPGDSTPMHLLRRIRGAGVAVDVIRLSSTADVEEVREAQRLGVTDFVALPTNPHRIVQALRQTLRYRDAPAARFGQQDIDQLRSLALPPRPWIPKELSEDRLREVRQLLEALGGPVSASELAERLGTSRVTARRYLEHLVSLGELECDSLALSVGRPQKIYDPMLAAIS